MERLAQRDHYMTARTSLAELVQALKHPQWEIRAEAMRMLGLSGEQVPIDALVVALHDEHRMVRASAVQAWGHQGAEVSIEHLLHALQDHEWEVREMAVLALGQSSKRVPQAVLMQAQQDSSVSVREAALYVLDKQPSTSAAMMQKETQEKTYSAASRWMVRWAIHLWLVFSRQIPLMHKSTWTVPFLSMLIWCCLTLYAFLSSSARIHDAELTLSLLTTLSAAVGTAFMYSKEYDPGFELALSTQTSTRIIMLSRFLIVTGFNILLTFCASGLLALMHGGGIWSILHVWLGPMLLTASISTMLSLMIGAGLATLTACILETSQTFSVIIQHNIPVVVMIHPTLWQTNLPILLLAIIFLLGTLFYVPRQPHRMHL
jgi:hypothetical protein